MSESNKKKITFLQVIIYYFIIAIIVTSILVFLNLKFDFSIKSIFVKPQESAVLVNKDNSKKVEKEERRNSEKVKKLEYSDKYYVNNLQFETKTEEYGDNVVYSDGYVSDLKKFNINYVQISGLKNKDVEEKINKEIYDKVEEIYSKYKNNKDVRLANIMISGIGNFADVLSLEVYVFIEYNILKDENLNTYEVEEIHSGLNYILETGEKIKFNELFTEDTSIKAILSKEAYETLAHNYLYKEREKDENFYGDMEKINYPEIEDNLLKIMSEYNQNNDIDFYFSTTYINAYINSECIYINTKDIRDNLAIYSRFLSENTLYENGNLDKLDYACNAPVSQYEYIYKEVADNIFIDIYANSWEEYPERTEKTRALADKLVEKLISESSNDKAYIYNFDSNYNEWDSTTTADGMIIEIDREYYEKNKDLILCIFQDLINDMVSYEEYNGLIDESKINIIFNVSYKYENGEIINTTETVDLEEIETEIEYSNEQEEDEEEINNIVGNVIIVENIITNEIN